MKRQALNEAPPGTLSHAHSKYAYTAYRRQLGIEPMLPAPAKASLVVSTKTDLDKKDSAAEHDTSKKGKGDLPYTYVKSLEAARKKETGPVVAALDTLESSGDIDAAVTALNEARITQAMDYLRRIITRYGKAADDDTLSEFIRGVKFDVLKKKRQNLIGSIAGALGLDNLVAAKLYDVASQLVR